MKISRKLSKATLCAALFLSTSAAVNAAEWSVTKTVSPFTLRISASSCYDQPDKMNVSFDWTKALAAYDSTNVTMTCSCGQSLVLNETIKVTSSNLAELVQKDFSLDLQSYKCVEGS